MIFSYKWLQSYFKKPLPAPKKLAELLTVHNFEVEEIKNIKYDWTLDIDVLPNRGPDCFSHIGIAREITAITELRMKDEELRIREDKGLKAKDFLKVEIENKNDCYRYNVRIITGVDVKSSPRWVQERLRACGLRPINNVVDITNYTMLETGQPLHAFDLDKISGIEAQNLKSKAKKIIVRRARKGEKITTLDDEKYDLDEDVLVIADSKRPLAIAGIKGGRGVEIDKKTKTIALESANFNPELIHQVSRKIKLKTDASWRFEHGIDPNLTETAINRAVYLIQEISGGRAIQGLVDFYPKKVIPKKIKLNLNYVEKLLGLEISEKKIGEILKRLNFKIAKIQSSSSQVEVDVPAYRLDVSIPEDLIEEIGRIYGFQNIPAVFPKAALISPKKNFVLFWDNEIKNFLKELGFSEIYNYSFVGEKEMEIFGYGPGEIVEVENPISIDQKYLRPSLIPNLLKNVKENFKRLPVEARRIKTGFEKIKIFELGKTFKKIKNSENKTEGRQKGTSLSQLRAKITEKIMLTGLIAQKNGGDENFYQLKGTIDSLLNRAGISDIWYDSYQQTPEESRLAVWDFEKSAEIKIGQEEVGFLGEISSSVLKNAGISGRVVLFDIDFEKLIKLCSEEQEYRPISQYPAAVRDLSILMPKKVKAVDVLNKVNAIGGPLIRDVDIFDIYEGEELPNGKKNLAFHLIYQAENRTLTSKEIDKIQNKIIKELEKDPEWEVRR